MPWDVLGSAGLLSISIDLELELNRQTAVRQAQLEDLTKELLALFDQYQVSATWAVADPAHSAARDAILAASAPHELAVLGDGAWIASGNVPTRLNRELSRRFEGARRAGLAVSTLALRGANQLISLGLLLAHKVTALRGEAQTGNSQEYSPLSYGVWQALPALGLPLKSSWWRPASRQIKRELTLAAGGQRPLYVALNADEMVDQADASLDQVETLLRQACQMRSRGAIDIGTLGEIAAWNLNARASVPSRSVLRPAA